ncbi:SCO family protein [Aurantimonas sp. Leaf443]|uniref:SCO family protein n=1 Tax=Aurantimonas sp. Leaf443 TaxID=1736378 RepID=UPI0006FA61A4|nr:SCO family protein [Aurantimonas sp. Leaf443]KQT86063.1 cytochrome oxidase assembly protein [Aurantimonas sp. Leaf443]
MSKLRIILWSLVGLVAGAALAVAILVGRGGTASEEVAFGAPFKLVDQNGAPVTEAIFKGRPSAVFFGFTHCPDVCPTTLFELAGHEKAMKAEGKDLNVVFVTVDPERDTPAVIKPYVEAVAPDITAITGAPAEVAAMTKSWGVYSRKVGEGDDYQMDHTATTYLIDRNGAFAGTIAYGENPDTARAKLEKLAGA